MAVDHGHQTQAPAGTHPTEKDRHRALASALGAGRTRRRPTEVLEIFRRSRCSPNRTSSIVKACSRWSGNAEEAQYVRRGCVCGVSDDPLRVLTGWRACSTAPPDAAVADGWWGRPGTCLSRTAGSRHIRSYDRGTVPQRSPSHSSAAAAASQSTLSALLGIHHTALTCDDVDRGRQLSGILSDNSPRCIRRPTHMCQPPARAQSSCAARRRVHHHTPTATAKPSRR